MGAKHSFPVPTEQDFTKKPIPKSSTTAISPLCQAFSTDGATATTDGIRLTLPPHAWDTKQDKHGTVTYIPELNIKLVASVVPEQNNKDDNNPMLLVQNAHDKDDNTILAVLVQPLQYPRPIQICTPHKPNSGAKLVVRNYQRQNFYEYATVDKIRDSKQHLMRIPTSTNVNDNGNALLWRTDKCGKQGVLRDYIIHAVNSIHQHKHKNKTSTNDLLLGAYLQEQAKDSFTMRIAASNHHHHDPLLMVCFALAIERWRVRDLEFLRQASTIKIHNTGGRGFLKHVL